MDNMIASDSLAASVVPVSSEFQASGMVTGEVSLYLRHVEEKLARFQQILELTGFEEIIIASGEVKVQFQDDLFYPFKANPYFREWAPLNKRAGCYLHIKKTASKPELFLLTAEDIWHTARQALPVGFDQGFDCIDYESLEDIKQQLDMQLLAECKLAFIGEDNTLDLPTDCLNPKSVLKAIDFYRCQKTPYEQHCVRQANRLAAPAHSAAYHAFMDGCSEQEIAAAYYAASNTCESDMPYSIIAGVNEHAAVLHHYNLSKESVLPYSFLIDAGIDYHGYASDITRTYTYDDQCEFAEMIRLMDTKQQALVAAGAIDKSPVDMHKLCLRKVAEVLVEFGMLTISVDKAIETDVVDLFLPHGLGHHLGCNVHDKGSQFINAMGERIEPPEEFPKLRHTAPMVANQVYTIEPGLYFIPSRLQTYSKGKNTSYVVWDKVEQFIPYGGIRIEDNIILHADNTLENLTRDAFAELA